MTIVRLGARRTVNVSRVMTVMETHGGMEMRLTENVHTTTGPRTRLAMRLRAKTAMKPTRLAMRLCQDWRQILSMDMTPTANATPTYVNVLNVTVTMFWTSKDSVSPDTHLNVSDSEMESVSNVPRVSTLTKTLLVSNCQLIVQLLMKLATVHNALKISFLQRWANVFLKL